MKFYEGFDKERAAQLAPAIRMLLGENGFSVKTVATEKNYDLTGKKAVVVKCVENLDEQYAAIEKAIADAGEAPEYVAVEGFATFAAGATKAAADAAADKLLGGKGEYTPCHCYRRIADKIIIVTGSAQGFGQGIAEALLENGAAVVIADLNYELAETNCKKLAEKYGSNVMLS